MNQAEIQEIFNQTFAGLAFFYRDTNLSEDLISRYQSGQILRELGFTDMSVKGGGLADNCRYLIASSSALDLSAINPACELTGHFLLNALSYFKILDIYKIEEKTQILLLNIADTTVEFFEGIIANIEKDLIQKAREDFDLKIKANLIPNLQTEDWKKRTEVPIGVNEKGAFFYKKVE